VRGRGPARRRYRRSVNPAGSANAGSHHEDAATAWFPAPAAPGRLLDGRYRVGALIARGGMSTVHHGTDLRLDRPVAIKVMDPRLAGDPVFRTRFEREARSAARIDHPAVVDVHDQGADGAGVEPVLFLVMELVEGGTLRDVLRARAGGGRASIAGSAGDRGARPARATVGQGAIGVPAAFAVLEPVLAGLAEAHRLGLVHRDVKPENVLISRAGEVKVADFGLVTAAAHAGASHVGTIMGTVTYLSPEQVATGAADARSDVYAVGILLYELLTGEPPYTGDTSISVAYRHVTSRVPAPSLITADVPAELDALVLRATEHDPAARFADADALLGALRELRDRLAIPRVPAPIPPGDRSGAAGQHRVGPTGTAMYPGPAAGPAGYAGPGGTRAMPRGTGAREHPGEVRPAAFQGRGGRRSFLAWIAVLIALGLLVATTSWWLGTGRWTVMPSVVGLEQAVAEQVLADADLVAEAAPMFSDDVVTGLVVAADRQPGAELERGSPVALTVSAGRPVVPDIPRGTAVAAAELLLREAGLDPVQDTDDRRGRDRFDSDLPAGSVLRTDPRAGTVLSVDAPVALVLNVEQEQVEVPFLIGRSADAAREALEDRGLEVEVESQLPFFRGLGTVIGQSPGPGSTVEPGTTVMLSTV